MVCCGLFRIAYIIPFWNQDGLFFDCALIFKWASTYSAFEEGPKEKGHRSKGHAARSEPGLQTHQSRVNSLPN